MSWKEVTLEKLCKIKHGYAFKSEFFEEQGNFVVTTPGHFHEEGGFRKRDGKEKFYTGSFDQEYLLKKGDLILAMTEQGAGLLGSPALIPENNKYLHNQRLGLVNILDSQALDKTFLYYFFHTKVFRYKIFASANGTKVRHTSPKRILNEKINLPPLPTQRKIAAILSAYDELIENNNRRIAILEQMAGEVYKEWFVRMRFPGWREKPFVEGVPEGWEEIRVGNAFKILGGGTPSRDDEDYWDNGNINWFTPSDITRANGFFLPESSTKTNERGVRNSSTKMFPPYSVMLTSRATIGAVGINTIPACTNQGFITCIPNPMFPYPYILNWILEHKPLIEIVASGATFKEISRSVFKKLKILAPQQEVSEKYMKTVEPLYKQMELLQKKNQLLQETRDLLLPRLVNGKLGVEHLLEEKQGSF